LSTVSGNDLPVSVEASIDVIDGLEYVALAKSDVRGLQEMQVWTIPDHVQGWNIANKKWIFL